MKRKVTWMLILLLSILLVACDNNASDKKNKSDIRDGENTEEYAEEVVPIVCHQLYLDFEMLLPSDLGESVISVGIDEDLIELPNDEYFTNMSEVEEGEHAIGFYIDGILDENSVQTIDVNADTHFSCFVSYLEGKIVVCNQLVDNDLSDSAILYEDLVGLSLPDALQKLEDMHFVNIDYVPNDSNQIVANEDWVVESQNVTAGTLLDKTAPIELVCDKVYFMCYVDLTFDSNLVMARYGLDMYIDDEMICNIPHGTAYDNLIRLKEGDHSITFYKDKDNNVFATKNFKLDADYTINANLHTNDKDIEINDYNYIAGVKGAYIEVCEVKGMFLDDAITALGNAGVGYISINASDSTTNRSQWIVVEQSAKAGELIGKDDSVTLTCKFNTDYLTDVYLSKTVDVIIENAAEYNNTVKYMRFIDKSDMTSKVNSMSSADKMNWVSGRCSIEDGVYIIELKYNGDVEVPDLVDMSVDEAIAQLESLEFSSIEISPSKSDYTGYIVDAQSVKAGTKYCAKNTITLTIVSKSEIENAYAKDNYADMKLDEAKKVANNLGDSLAYVRYADSANIYQKLKSISADEEKLWYVKDATMDSGVVSLKLEYQGEATVPDVKDMTLDVALGELHSLELYNITFSSSINKNDYKNYKVTSQSVVAGTVQNATNNIKLELEYIEVVTQTETTAQAQDTNSTSTTNTSNTNSSSSKDKYASGKYAYKSTGGQYTIYIIVDMDAGYVYRFIDDESTCDCVKIKSGTLNDTLIIEYHDGADTWQNGLHFKYVNNPATLILEDSYHFETEFKETTYSNASSKMSGKTKIYY